MHRIEASEVIHPRNKELLNEYRQDQIIRGLSNATLSRNIIRLKSLSDHLGDRQLDKLEKSELKEIVVWLHERDYTEETIDTYKKVIRSFYKWLNDGEVPETADWIKMSVSNGGNNNTLPKDLLTKADIKKQIKAAKNDRDKALIAVLYETGARIGELIDLTVDDIEDRKHGMKVVIEGKTGARRLPLVESVPHLNRWLSRHPNPSKDAPLWCKINQSTANKTLDPNEIEDLTEIYGIGPNVAERLRDHGIESSRELVSRSAAEIASIEGITENRVQGWLDQFNPNKVPQSDQSLGYQYIRDKILIKTMREAGIDKPANPHHYRHSRASYLANHLKEAQLCAWFGWVQGSDVPARYVHLSGRDIDNAYDAIHGLYEPEEREEPNVLKCIRCNQLNEDSALFCMQCGFAIGSEAAEIEHSVESDIKDDYRDTDPGDTDRMAMIQLIDRLLDDPEFKSAIVSQLDT